ncbi:hypothetical protein ACLOJK_019334 [Asimina triloba]
MAACCQIWALPMWRRCCRRCCHCTLIESVRVWVSDVRINDCLVGRSAVDEEHKEQGAAGATGKEITFGFQICRQHDFSHQEDAAVGKKPSKSMVARFVATEIEEETADYLLHGGLYTLLQS